MFKELGIFCLKNSVLILPRCYICEYKNAGYVLQFRVYRWVVSLCLWDEKVCRLLELKGRKDHSRCREEGEAAKRSERIDIFTLAVGSSGSGCDGNHSWWSRSGGFAMLVLWVAGEEKRFKVKRRANG